MARKISLKTLGTPFAEILARCEAEGIKDEAKIKRIVKNEMFIDPRELIDKAINSPTRARREARLGLPTEDLAMIVKVSNLIESALDHVILEDAQYNFVALRVAQYDFWGQDSACANLLAFLESVSGAETVDLNAVKAAAKAA